MRILMVCLGNICRSPMAEGVLRHKVKQHGLNWTVESAGTESYHIGEAPHQFSQKICRENGIDIADYCARKFTPASFENYDKIYAFAHDVYLEIERIGGRFADMTKVDYFLNELLASGLEVPGFRLVKNTSVPDPYYGNEEGYRLVYQLVDKTCDAIIARYNNNK